MILIYQNPDQNQMMLTTSVSVWNDDADYDGDYDADYDGFFSF